MCIQTRAKEFLASANKATAVKAPKASSTTAPPSQEAMSNEIRESSNGDDDWLVGVQMPVLGNKAKTSGKKGKPKKKGGR
mmetsp:Transcript_59403/g.102299  ORF Transcript_59403/g.102299 Transcript_59403/m.102299 type:complete len:80 (+) Transcript_59403:8-247(+)